MAGIDAHREAAAHDDASRPVDVGAVTPRPVGAALGIAILLVPPIFAWFLLREGYAARARLLGFGWLAFHMLVFLAIDPSPETGAAGRVDDAVEEVAAPAEAIAANSQGFMSAPPVAKRPGELKPGELSDPACTRTDETEGWDSILVNAILTADRYAVANNPKAAFADARGRVSWNPDPDHTEDLKKGTWSLILTNDQVALAELVPLFDFCTPASTLDPEGELWEVRLAKLHGKFF